MKRPGLRASSSYSSHLTTRDATNWLKPLRWGMSGGPGYERSVAGSDGRRSQGPGLDLHAAQVKVPWVIVDPATDMAVRIRRSSTLIR